MSVATADMVDTAATSILNINMTNVSKLSSTNYMMWKLQVKALLDGYDLANFLDAAVVPPNATATVDEAVVTNPAYT